MPFNLTDDGQGIDIAAFPPGEVGAQLQNLFPALLYGFRISLFRLHIVEHSLPFSPSMGQNRRVMPNF